MNIFLAYLVYNFQTAKKMFEKKGNPINNIGGGKYVNDSKIAKKNIYSKIAPPNTFKRRTVNKIAPKIIQRYEIFSIKPN